MALPPNIIDLANMRDRPRDHAPDDKVPVEFILSACAQKPSGQMTMMRTDDLAYVYISPENIETIALRVVELLREKKT